jgi:hypothetical protein
MSELSSGGQPMNESNDARLLQRLVPADDRGCELCPPLVNSLIPADEPTGSPEPVESPSATEARADGSGDSLKRMDCPTVMREHFWSIPNNGWVECLWCFEKRRTDGGKPSAGGNR